MQDQAADLEPEERAVDLAECMSLVALRQRMTTASACTVETRRDTTTNEEGATEGRGRWLARHSITEQVG